MKYSELQAMRKEAGDLSYTYKGKPQSVGIPEPTTINTSLNRKTVMDSLNTAGIKTTPVGQGDIQLPSEPLAIPRAVFKPTKDNDKVMQQVEEMSQKNRANLLGTKYNKGTAYRIPDEHIFGLKPTYTKGHEGDVSHRYAVTKDGLLPGAGNMTYASIRRPPVTVAGVYVPPDKGRFGFGASLGAVVHENNHDFTPIMNIRGTASREASLIPAFEHGPAAALMQQFINTGRYDLEPRISQQLKGNKGYPTQLLPNSYYNSIPETFTAARTLKQYMASKGIPSVGVHTNLDEKELQNGTVPFNTGMIRAGLWKPNPNYTGKVPSALDNISTYVHNLSPFSKHKEAPPQWEPKYLPAASITYPKEMDYKPTVKLDDLQYTQEPSVNYLLMKESEALRKQFNYMQYLMDLGDDRTEEQQETLERLQKTLPLIFETASNQRNNSFNKTAAPQYALQEGENPSVLDKRFGFRQGTIAGLNPGLNYRKLQIGQKLNMPAGWRPQKTTPTASRASYHTIASGDTMQGLDKRYGLPIGSFERANPGLDYNKLQIGQRVNMPARQVASPAPAPAPRPATPKPQPQRPPVKPVVQTKDRQPFAGPSEYNVNGALMQESLNGRYTNGDIRQGYAYARGPLQIREVFPSERAAYERRRAGKAMTYVPVIDDVNDHFGTSYTADDRNDPAKSRELYRLYLERYGRAFYNRHGRNPTDEEYWRMWNGGPNGYRNPKTEAYAQAIRAKYENPAKWGLTPGVMYKPKG
jgi:LysM repeat protein